MLTPNERYQIIVRLSMVNPDSIWGVSIANFNQRAFAHTDEEILRIVEGLQSQIDDNEKGMREVLGEQFEYIDCFRRKEDLNINNNIKLLLQKAVRRFNTIKEQAQALGVCEITVRNYLVDYNILNPKQ